MKIDKTTMEIIREMEAQLQSFHGMRHLWAELVANREPCGLTKEKLEEQQAARLTAALGQAYTLATMHGIQWVGCSKERDFIKEFADEPCQYGDNCPDHGTKHYRCVPCKARLALKIFD